MANASMTFKPARLAIRRGSIFAPLFLLLVTIFMFVVYALPSQYGDLGSRLGLANPNPTASEIIDQIGKTFTDDKSGKSEKFWESFENKPQKFFSELVQPMLKVYLEQIAADFKAIASNVVVTTLILGLYALIPGLAGLIYRRNFTFWFLVGFGTLFCVNASGLFPNVAASSQPMPESGKLLLFFLSQIVIVVLASRLQRRTTSTGLLPQRIHNCGLIALLSFVGVACWMGWGPGYTDTASIDAGNASTEVAHRSWIWGFLGTGVTGWIYKWEFILFGLPLLYALLRNSAAWTGRARKNIVICLDGTTNTPDQVEQGFAATTNVYKLFRMLKADAEGAFPPETLFDASLCKRYGEKQIAFYYAGVGNKYDNDNILQVIGMATGLGAEDIVERAYLDLIRVYRPGDRVYVFGFSRGAAIARLLARAIDARGAPQSVWTIKLFGKRRSLRRSKTKTPVPVDVLGCWDTVGSFGVAKTIAGINFQQLNLFKDLSVPENVQQAYHMVALDEQRDGFEPTLMNPDPNRPERIVEVWFAGDHANIGGGWATDRLSDITLDYLLRRISSGYAGTEALAGKEDETSWGLHLKAWKADKLDYWERQEDNPHIVDPDPLGQIQQWFSHLYEYRPRKLPQHAVISDSVFKRMIESLPLYAPQALFNLNDELDKRRDLIDGQISKMVESALLTEEDLKKIEGYKSKLRINRFEEYWESELLPARRGKFKLPHDALAHHDPGQMSDHATI